jgi:hypothetical protein
LPTDSREYANHVSGVVWVNDVPWHLYGQVLMPLSMPHVPLDVDRAEVRRAMSRTKALLACWTTHWDAYEDSEWWWVACDQNGYDLDNLTSGDGRQSIRKGLRNCSVKRVEAVAFRTLAYPIQRAAMVRYGEHPPTEADWAAYVDQLSGYAGTEFWGAFYDGQLAAFTICLVIDGAVDLGAGKSDPDLHKYKPNAALFYTLCKHYLGNGLSYVTNGSRTLSHPTEINTFLEKLGFRRVPCRVNVELSATAKVVDAARLLVWGRHVGLPRLFGARWSQLESFDKLMTISRTFEAEPKRRD